MDVKAIPGEKGDKACCPRCGGKVSRERGRERGERKGDQSRSFDDDGNFRLLSLSAPLSFKSQEHLSAPAFSEYLSVAMGKALLSCQTWLLPLTLINQSLMVISSSLLDGSYSSKRRFNYSVRKITYKINVQCFDCTCAFSWLPKGFRGRAYGHQGGQLPQELLLVHRVQQETGLYDMLRR